MFRMYNELYRLNSKKAKIVFICAKDSNSLVNMIHEHREEMLNLLSHEEILVQIRFQHSPTKMTLGEGDKAKATPRTWSSGNLLKASLAL